MCLGEVDSQQPQQVAANGKVVDVVKMSRMLRCTAHFFFGPVTTLVILNIVIEYTGRYELYSAIL